MKLTFNNLLLMTGLLSLTTLSCKTGTGTSSDTLADTIDVNLVEEFDADTAFSYVVRQVALGPRVPGTSANVKCAEMIISELTRHGADTVFTQKGNMTAFNGDILPVTNVMGRFNSASPKRILLLAHYDTRPWADSDRNEENHMLPIPGANDGASGVAVMLEIARKLGLTTPGVGVDMLFVDAEDYGQAGGFSNHDESWALGSQMWARSKPYENETAPAYGILLDMVGGIGAKFHREFFSDRYAPQIVNKVWSIAAASGYGDRFVNIKGGAVVDDHLAVNEIGIPTIDIIESKHDATGTFSPTWHTLDDDIGNIDRSSLKAVGQTVLNVIYNEKP